MVGLGSPPPSFPSHSFCMPYSFSFLSIHLSIPTSALLWRKVGHQQTTPLSFSELPMEHFFFGSLHRKRERVFIINISPVWISWLASKMNDPNLTSSLEREEGIADSPPPPFLLSMFSSGQFSIVFGCSQGKKCHFQRWMVVEREAFLVAQRPIVFLKPLQCSLLLHGRIFPKKCGEKG